MREPVFIHVLNSVPSQFTHATRDRRHTVCRSSSSLSPLVRGVHLSNSRVRLKPRRRVSLRTGRWHCAAAVPAAGLSYFQHRCRSTELSVPATGGEPVAWRRAGPSQHEHHCSCGATAGRSWSRRADKLLVATSIHEACGLRDACAAAAAPPSKCEQQWRGPGSGTGQRREHLPTACSSRRRGAFKYEKQQRLNRSEIRFARERTDAELYPKKRSKRKPFYEPDSLRS